MFHSGSLITAGLGETSYVLNHNGEELTIILNFVDDNDKTAKLRREVELVDSTTAKFTFFNYKNALGTYSTEPLPLGSIGGRELIFQYRIDDLQSLSKLVFYTFYLGKEVENG